MMFCQLSPLVLNSVRLQKFSLWRSSGRRGHDLGTVLREFSAARLILCHDPINHTFPRELFETEHPPHRRSAKRFPWQLSSSEKRVLKQTFVKTTNRVQVIGSMRKPGHFYTSNITDTSTDRKKRGKRGKGTFEPKYSIFRKLWVWFFISFQVELFESIKSLGRKSKKPCILCGIHAIRKPRRFWKLHRAASVYAATGEWNSHRCVLSARPVDAAVILPVFLAENSKMHLHSW